MEIDHIFQR